MKKFNCREKIAEGLNSLAELRPGESAYVQEVRAEGCQRRRLLDIGLVNRTLVKCLGKSPAGDPAAYLIRGAVIALQAEDSARIILGD